jgi:hypothetical protein
MAKRQLKVPGKTEPKPKPIGSEEFAKPAAKAPARELRVSDGAGSNHSFQVIQVHVEDRNRMFAAQAGQQHRAVPIDVKYTMTAHADPQWLRDNFTALVLLGYPLFVDGSMHGNGHAVPYYLRSIENPDELHRFFIGDGNITFPWPMVTLEFESM